MTIYYLAVCVLLILVFNAILVMCELSLVAFRYRALGSGMYADSLENGALKTLIERSARVSKSLKIMQHASLLLMGVLFYEFLPQVGLIPDVAFPIKVLTSVALAAITHHVLAYLLPRTIALSRPFLILRTFAVFVLVLDSALWFIHKLSHILDQAIQRLFSTPTPESVQDLDVEVQIQAMNQDDFELTPVCRKIIKNALRMRELEISDVLLPRHQVQIFDLNDSLEENLTRASQTGHTRFPLCNGDLDHCVGIIHVKDIFRRAKDNYGRALDLKRIRRNIMSLPADVLLEKALERMLVKKMHMALVSDEFGGVIGVLTLESILEVIVGEIQDEFDYEEALVKPTGTNTFAVSGLASLHEVEQALGIEIDNDEISSFGGLITSEIGRIPEQSERIRLDDVGIEVEIIEVDEKRVIATRVHMLPPE